MIYIEIIEYNSKLYPQSLKIIENPPKMLYAEGNTKLLNSYSISIIGSRICSSSGIKIAKMFSKELATNGITIISGMALGIDTAAHIGCLEASGHTIAVLGCGLNNIYPNENIMLYKKIIENNGLIISEYPPDTSKSSEKLLARNRIVSGLSNGVLVIEASYRSGTSSTVAHARKQNKEIFCIPHDLDNKYGLGSNMFIKKGAKLVTSPNDILKS